MKRDLTHALDECLTLLREGRATLEECLACYPEHASSLRPLLEVAREVSHLPSPASSPAAFASGRQGMLQALAEKKHHQAVSSAPLLRRMPAFQLALAAVLALVLFAVGRLVFLPRPAATVARVATLVPVEGEVEIMPTGSAIWRPASVSERMQAGERIRTGPLSAATLVFFDGSTTDLQAETEIAIVQASSRPGGGSVIVLRQALGQAYSRVQRLPGQASRFEIETPAAVASVHGTEFTVAVEADGTTRVAVVEGVVEVTAQETTVAVPAGQEITVRPERAPSLPTPIVQVTPTPTPTPTTAPAPTTAPIPTCTPQPSDQIESLQAPGQAETPQPPGQTKTPQPPGQTKTPQPPGQTKTPQPPGQTKTPQPPGQNEPPQPPGQNKPKPPKKS